MLLPVLQPVLHLLPAQPHARLSLSNLVVAVVQVLASSLQGASWEEPEASASHDCHYCVHSQQVVLVEEGELVVLVAVEEVQACWHTLRDMQKEPSLVVNRVGA